MSTDTEPSVPVRLSLADYAKVLVLVVGAVLWLDHRIYSLSERVSVLESQGASNAARRQRDPVEPVSTKPVEVRAANTNPSPSKEVVP